MAKSKEDRIKQPVSTADATEIPVEETIQEPVLKDTQAATKGGPSYEELVSLVQALSQQVASLSQNKAASENSQQSFQSDEILKALMSRKSDKEVVIVHNREMIGGLTTHIDLSTINIDLHSLGEQRVLSWQQFEELASKYRSFFEQEIILLGPGQSDIAARYNLPVINRGNNHIVSHDEVENIYKLNARELEDFINTLTDKDKDFIFSYWLGKSYERVEGFYDRYKIELLNRLSGKHVFDNILVLMNGDFLNDTDGSVEIKANSKNTFNK